MTREHTSGVRDGQYERGCSRHGTLHAPAIDVGLDRRKNDFDVMERVLGSVRDDEGAPHTDVVSVDVRPGVIASTESAIQLTVMGRADGDSRRRDRHRS